MALEEQIRKIQALRTALPKRLAEAEIMVSRDLKSDIQDRIQEEGLDGEEYSPSYKKQKQRSGKPADKVNLTFSGDMWRQIDFKDIQGDEDFTETVIGPTTSSAQRKVNDNEKRYGNFLVPTDKEIQNAEEIYRLEVLEIIRQGLR